MLAGRCPGHDPYPLPRPFLDAAVAAMQAQAQPAHARLAGRQVDLRAEADPDYLKGAPYDTPVRRLDEVKAARRPVLRYGFPGSDDA